MIELIIVDVVMSLTETFIQLKTCCSLRNIGK